jgi:hypothetical protein
MKQFILKVMVGSVVFVVTSIVTVLVILRLMVMFNIP